VKRRGYMNNKLIKINRVVILVITIGVIASCGLSPNPELKNTRELKELEEKSGRERFFPAEWKKFNVCKISFFAPKTLTLKNMPEMDSCVAEFGDEKRLLTIDYGWYTKPNKKDDDDNEFTEEFIEIDGKKAQVTSAKMAKPFKSFNYWAAIHVVVKKDSPEFETSLSMGILVEDKSDLRMAKKIFRSIRFIEK